MVGSGEVERVYGFVLLLKDAQSSDKTTIPINMTTKNTKLYISIISFLKSMINMILFAMK